MKGEYGGEDQHNNHHRNYNNNNNNNNNININTHSNTHSHHPMFPKFPTPHLHFPPHNHNSFPFPITTAKDTNNSPASAATDTSPSAKKLKTASTSAEDAGTIEVPRRPRGRPPGSKNKPRPPVVITRDPEQPAMAPYILELQGGCDIVDSLTRFTRRRGVGICVLTASGAVANVTLKQPSPAAPGATVTFHGKFDILSLSAVCLVQTVPFGSGNCDFAFTISLAGPQGQIVGGIVVGPLLSAGTVYVVATSFNTPSFHRLPLDDDDEEGHNPAPCGGDSSPVSGGGSSGGGGQMGLYSCHMGSSTSDVIWTPTVRPPPPHPHPHPPY